MDNLNVVRYLMGVSLLCLHLSFAGWVALAGFIYSGCILAVVAVLGFVWYLYASWKFNQRYGINQKHRKR